MENWGPMYSFSACMTSKIFQLKFVAHKFSLSLKECNGAVLNRLKRISGLGPNFPIRSSGDPNFIIAKVSNLPIASSKGPQINVPLRHQEPNFPFTSSGHLAPQFLHCFIKGFQLPHCIIKGQRALNFPLRHQGPTISSSCHQNGVTSNFPSRYQGVPFIIAS